VKKWCPFFARFSAVLFILPARVLPLAGCAGNLALLHAQLEASPGTALIFATQFGLEAVVRALLAAGADVDKADRRGRIALMLPAI
jgi:hypothetical protein